MRGSGRQLVRYPYDPGRRFISRWPDTVRAVPGRRVRSVHDHAQRLYEPYCDRGSWTDKEDLRLIR